MEDEGRERPQKAGAHTQRGWGQACPLARFLRQNIQLNRSACLDLSPLVLIRDDYLCEQRSFT